ncbi:hypothetical protein D3C71_1510830 [compost metagenome]
MPRQMDLAVLADDLGRTVNQDGGVELAAFRSHFRIAQVKPDAQLARGVEQRLHIGIGHGLFKEAVHGFRVFHPVAREEGRQGEFREHDEFRLATSGLAHHLDQAAHNHRAGVGKVHGAHLGDRQAHFAGGGWGSHDVNLQEFFRMGFSAGGRVGWRRMAAAHAARDRR